jgi:hypothetical protein
MTHEIDHNEAAASRDGFAASVAVVGRIKET